MSTTDGTTTASGQRQHLLQHSPATNSQDKQRASKYWIATAHCATPCSSVRTPCSDSLSSCTRTGLPRRLNSHSQQAHHASAAHCRPRGPRRPPNQYHHARTISAHHHPQTGNTATPHPHPRPLSSYAMIGATTTASPTSSGARAHRQAQAQAQLQTQMQNTNTDAATY